MAGPYFEEFEPGREFTHELSRRATEHDNIFFSLMTMNPRSISTAISLPARNGALDPIADPDEPRDLYGMILRAAA